LLQAVLENQPGIAVLTIDLWETTPLRKRLYHITQEIERDFIVNVYKNKAPMLMDALVCVI
jgi:hypothetical protein